MTASGKIKLYGFNNLTKNLSFSFYKLHYLDNDSQHQHYNNYINNRYGADKLSKLLTDICHAIGGNILNIAQQDYRPQGASVTLMISEEAQAESLVAHLDKSHICVHTYPDDNIQNGVAIFRADIELSTCGVISPLKVLNYLIEEFGADVIDIDYRVRGMTRNSLGIKTFSDQKITNISDFLSNDITEQYQLKSRNLGECNLHHVKLCRKNTSIVDYLFEANNNISSVKQVALSKIIQDEILQLFNSAS